MRKPPDSAKIHKNLNKKNKELNKINSEQQSKIKDIENELYNQNESILFIYPIPI